MASRSAQPYAVVVGLDNITGLQTARILAGRNVPVLGIAADPGNFCCRTRACERVLHAETATEELVEVLEDLGPGLDHKAVLYPCTDASVLVLSRNRARLAAWYHVALPEPEVVETLIDKIAFYTYANERSLPIPRTVFLRDRADAEDAAATLAFPSVLKPPVKTPSWERQADAKVYKVSSPSELLALYDRVSTWTDLLVVQEWIEGGEESLFSCNCYFDTNGRPLVTFVARKLRQWPPYTGTSSLGEECRNDAVLQETVQLFESVGYRGLGYLEMKRDRRTGKHLVIEANIGRPTGRSAIAEAGGVELLFAMYCDLTGLPLPAGLEQRYSGVKWIYWRADLPAAAFGWWRGELTLSQWLRSVRGRRTDAVLSWRDPLPFVLDFAGVPKALFQYLLRSRGRRRIDAAGALEGRAGRPPREQPAQRL
jgi:D-aspartate ligase